MADQPRDERPGDDPPAGDLERDPDPAADSGGVAPAAREPAAANDPARRDTGPHDPWATGEDTAVLPPAGGARRDQDRWTARAGVPPAEPQVAPEAWPEPEPSGQRRWWAPAVIALLALVLLAVLGLGIWLIARSQQGNPPVPVPPTSPAPSRTPSAPPSATPTSSPSTAQVAIPTAIIGLPVSDAQRLLGQLGLLSQAQPRTAPGATPGTVLDASPAPGTMVPVGSTVTLIVAVAPSPSPVPPSPTGAPSPTVTAGG